jgi:1-acyl-sn-glycerol-3-phosphate acyltransferase
MDLVTFAIQSHLAGKKKLNMAKRKIRFRFSILNILFVLYLAFLAILSPFLMIPGFLMQLAGKQKTADRLFNSIAKMFSKSVFSLFGVRVKVKGRENIPEQGNVCFVSNHQGLADIPLIIAYIPKTVGFIAKKELGNIPILNIWMRAMKCVLIDRLNARSAVNTINLAIENIKNGHAMVVFPEGTRSLSSEMGSFKPGSFKLVTGAGCKAVPVTISGTYKLIEATGKVTPTTVSLTIHPAIDVNELSKDEKAILSQRVENIVRSAL